MNTLPVLLAFVALSLTTHAATPKELTSLQQQYAFLITERVTGPYETGLETLNTKFATALEKAVTEAQTAGNLPAVLAIEEDRKRIAGKLPLPDTDDEKTPEVLKKLRAIYREQLAKITEARSANQAAILPGYTAKLQALEVTLTKAARVDEAKEVMTYREGLAANPAPAAPTVATPPASAATPASPAKAAVKTPRIKGDDRKAAEWVLTAGGKVKLSVGGTKIQVTDIKSLPREKFEVVEVRLKFFGGDKPAQPVTDLLPLAGLESLEVLDTAGLADLKDEHLTVLSSLPALQSVWFTAGRLTDATCAHIAAAPAVNNIHLGSQRLITGAGLAAFARMKKLEALYLEECTGVSEEGFAALAHLDQLRFVSLNRTALNDSQLTALAAIKGLKELEVKLCTSLTDAGLAAFKKARPDVMVEK